MSVFLRLPTCLLIHNLFNNILEGYDANHNVLRVQVSLVDDFCNNCHMRLTLFEVGQYRK